ncbi:SPOR domain-containing protein [Anthocerotibacter panamensis]|uniref:SPOR domain-containing protein n=1 Tax=Anthocerotibacter panamensis TaxID=2857077 RepID=UPI001C40713E|nr:SPOR domain-containing protein [Anthocerotibacter panamensis]
MSPGELPKTSDPACQSGLVLQLREFTDEELIGFALANPQEGRYLLCLYCRYRSLVESIVTSSQQSQVMAGTVWVQVRRRLDRLNVQENKFLSWLTALSADTLTQVLRGNQKLLTTVSAANPVVLAYIDQALQQLSPPQRFVVILHDAYQWSLAQIKSWMADQQWNLPVNQIASSLQQARQVLIATLPLDLRTLFWNTQDDLDEQLQLTLQGLEFDLDLEREGFRQWYSQQGTHLAAPTSRGLLIGGAVAALLALGIPLGWQGISHLQEDPALDSLAGLSPSAAQQNIPVQPEEQKAQQNIPVQPEEQKEASSPQAAPIARPALQKPAPNKIVPPTVSAAAAPPKPQTIIPPLEAKPRTTIVPAASRPAPVTANGTVASPTLSDSHAMARVLVVATTSEQVRQIKKQFPRSFSKTCSGSPCLQVGAFKASANAEQLANQLRAQGYTVNIDHPLELGSIHSK